MKNLKGKLLVGLLATTAAVCGAFGMSACFGNDGDGNKGGSTNSGGNSGSGGNFFDGHTHVDKDDNGGCDTCGMGFNEIVREITLNYYSLEINVGESIKLAAYADVIGEAAVNYVWSSTDQSVVKVDNGFVTAVGAGSAEIKVSIRGLHGLKEYTNCYFSVTKNAVAVNGVKLDRNKITLDVGVTDTLTATVSPVDADNQNVSWHTSNGNVATVNNGLITAVKPGVATITAETIDGSFKASCTVTVRGFNFSANYEGDEIKSYILTGKGTFDGDKLVIPETYNGKPVIGIGSGVFKDCVNITSVTIPDSIVSIEYDAFKGCTGLTDVVLPEGLTFIGEEAFKDCTELIEVSVPDSITELGIGVFEGCDKLSYTEFDNAEYLGNGDNAYVVLVKAKNNEITSCTINDKAKIIYSSAFEECTALNEINIPASVTDIGSEAFRNCSGLNSVDIGNGVKHIGIYAFNSCTALTDLVIGENVTEIGNWAFATCKSLERITLPDSVKDIGDHAFAGCQKMKNINIPNGVTDIELNTFSSCVSLESIEIPDSVTYIGHSAFNGCESLKSITIPESVKSFGSGIFYGCTNLTSVRLNSKITSLSDYRLSNKYYGFFGNCSSLESITLPDNVTEVGSNAFAGCTSLKEISVSANNKSYSTSDGILYNKEKTAFVCIPLGIESARIPDGIALLPSYAFKDCASLKNITIPDGITEIPTGAFKNCTSLKTVTIPDSVKQYGRDAFDGCAFEHVTVPALAISYISTASLKTVVITSGETIVYRAFENCANLTSVTLPGSVKCIYSDAFFNCTALNEVHVIDLAKWCEIHFESYESNPLYSGHNLYIDGELVTELKIPDGVTAISDKAFCGLNVSEVILPEGLKTIGRYAFSWCENLTGVIISDGVTEIGDGAFCWCDCLTDVSIPDSITYIGDGAFLQCDLLKYNEYDNALYLGNSANPYTVLIKAKDSGITTCEINKKTKVIYSFAFELCTELESITVPDSVISVGINIFNCPKLQYNEYDNALYLGNAENPYFMLAKAKNEDITSCTIHEDTKVILSYAFYQCNSLTSITIPESVIFIADYAFSWCEGLTDVTISDGVKVGEKAFVGSNNIENITASAEVLASILLYNVKTAVITGGDTVKNLLFSNCKQLTSVVLPDSITVIESNIFSECISLTTVIIPDGVITVDGNLFNGCVNLTDVVIPGSVKSLGNYWFFGCTSLKTVTFKGTKAQWNALEKDETWDNNAGAVTIHCTDGDITQEN